METLDKPSALAVPGPPDLDRGADYWVSARNKGLGFGIRDGGAAAGRVGEEGTATA